MSVEQVDAGVDTLDERARQIAAEAPELTAEQKQRLAALLGGAA